MIALIFLAIAALYALVIFLIYNAFGEASPAFFVTSAIILAFFMFFSAWNMFLLFYRDKKGKKLVSDESKCFSERCKSIVLKKEHNDKAVLMIHGFPTVPYMYNYSSQRLFEAGYDVYAPLIPTFGANIKEFEKTNFTQWFEFISDYYENLRKQYKFIAVLGISMGGAMTLKIGEVYSNTPLSPDALVSLSAPIAYNNIRYGIYSSYAAYFARTIGLFTPSIGASYIDGHDAPDDGNEDWVGYGGLFIKQGLSLSKAFDKIRKDLTKIKVPMFVMHDRNDKTVSFKNLAVICKFCGDNIKVKREVEMTEGSHTHHSLLMYHSVQEGYTNEIIDFIGGIYEQQQKK